VLAAGVVISAFPVASIGAEYTIMQPMSDITTNGVYLYVNGYAEYQGTPAKANTYYVVDIKYYSMPI
jgi:hypothetical protein